MKIEPIALLFAVSSWCVGCAEAGSGPATGGADATTTAPPTSGGAGGGASSATSGATTGGGTATGGSSSATGTTGAGGASPGGGIVINEISASGADWIELLNAGEAVVDLGDHALCDTGADGSCSVDDAARFPAGTLVPPHGYLLVVGDKPAELGVGPGTDCVEGGPTTCFYATWKVSASKGERVFFVGPGDAVIAEATYPKEAAPDGATWCRVPDATGAFGACDPTPGAANRAP